MNTDTTTANVTNAENEKGYWDEENNAVGLFIAVYNQGDAEEPSVSIALSSSHWYRVQYFNVTGCGSNRAWKILRGLMRECGRTLIGHAISDGEPFSYYEVPALSEKKVNQIYYLLKHRLTTEKLSFHISHGVIFNRNGIKAPPKRRRKKHRKLP